MKPTFIEAVSIPDAWFQLVRSIIETGYHYQIQHGSNVGQKRLSFKLFVVITITHAYQEPYDMMLPEIKKELGIPDPVEKGYIEQYMPYWMTDHLEPDELYTYGERLFESMNYWIEQLKKTPNTEQAILQIGKPSDHKLEHPPCCRHLDLKIIDNSLVIYPYFRSWDLWGGLPANLAGIAVLQKYIADKLGVGLGPIVASSKGLHLYDYVDELLQAYGQGYFIGEKQCRNLNQR